MQATYPILEYDSSSDAVIEPGNIHQRIDIPEHCMLCFFQDSIDKALKKGAFKTIKHLNSEIGNHPIYELTFEGKRIAVMHPGVGAPLSAGLLEELIALGSSKFIACGGAGVLDNTIGVGHVVVPTSAIRDEGTSYHYMPPGREALPSPVGVAAIKAVLGAHQVEYVEGKTWTNDAIYRETRAKVERRKKEGCLTVEMEAAAFFAVAQFRNVTFAQILYGGDDVSSETWDSRGWQTHISARDKLFWLAIEACLLL